MSESIQFRGPLEVEGPDDLDDDDNYMKPGLETAGLKNRQQKDQPSKKSLYFAVGCFITGLLYFYSTYDSPQQQYSPNYSTKTLFGCNRNQYFTPKECEFSSQECYLSVEFTGKCVVCNTGYSLDNGECKNCQETQNCTQQNLYANLYRSTNHPTEEIPYVIVNKENSQRILYVFETNLFDHLSNYSSLENTTIVQVEDYSLLNSPSYQPIFTDFIEYIETRLLNQKERIFLAHQTKAQGLITYLKSINSNDTVFIVEPQNLEEVFTPNGQYIIPLAYNKLLENSNLKIKLLYSTDQPEGFTCKKSNRILENSDKPTEVDVEEDESEEGGEEIVEEEEEKQQTPIIQEVECVKIQDGNFISQLIQP